MFFSPLHFLPHPVPHTRSGRIQRKSMEGRKAGRQTSVFCYFETANMTVKHMCRGGKNWLFGNYQRTRAALSSHSLLAKVFTEKESWHPRERGY